MSTDQADSGSIAAGRFEWEQALRHAELPAPVKLFGVWMATYADADGGSIRPGEQLVADHTGLTVQTVRRYMRSLREAQRIARVTRGGRASGRADTYRLTLPSPVTTSPVISSPMTEPQVTSSHLTGDEITYSQVTKPPPTRPRPDQDQAAARESPRGLAPAAVAGRDPWSEQEWRTAVDIGVAAVEGWTAAEATAAVTALVAAGKGHKNLVGYVRRLDPRAWRRWLDDAGPSRAPSPRRARRPAPPPLPPCATCRAPDRAPLAERTVELPGGAVAPCPDCRSPRSEVA